MTPLNLTSKNFCTILGITHNSEILKQLRQLNLVKYFKIGNKYMYHQESVMHVNKLLRNGSISIKTNGGYYVTLNKIQ